VARAQAEIGFVLLADRDEVVAQQRDQGLGEDRVPVLTTLAVAHQDLAALQIDVLDAQVQRLEESQTATIEKRSHDAIRTAQCRQHGAHLFPCEDDGYAPGTFGMDQIAQPREFTPQDHLVQE
jgi:hypothetical protein